MKKIYKYKLKMTEFQIVDLPEDSEILSVMSQPPSYGEMNDSLYMWVKLDDEKPLAPRRIRIFGTGHDMEYQHELRFIGTVSMNHNSLIWHVFENYKENQ